MTHPNFVKRNQSRETLQSAARMWIKIGSERFVAPLPPRYSRGRRLKSWDRVYYTRRRCVNFYGIGQWPDHVDSRKFERPLVTVSLGSQQCVVFKRRGVFHDVPVGSALRLDGCAANDWTHGLPPASPRISLTFRRLNAETKSKFEEEARRVKNAATQKKNLKEAAK